MKTIKIIDLLNKIANGEEVPKKIRYKGHIYQYQYKEVKEANIINYYHSEETHRHLIDGSYHDIRLNDEVEIIEEKKLPEKINVKGSYNSNKGFEDFNDNEKILVDKINEILDYLESKEKGE